MDPWSHLEEVEWGGGARRDERGRAHAERWYLPRWLALWGGGSLGRRQIGCAHLLMPNLTQDRERRLRGAAAHPEAAGTGGMVPTQLNEV